jgi:hypothetical protein
VSGDIERELTRVVERLRTTPLTKIGISADLAYATAAFIVDRTPGTPDALPRLADHAIGDQLAVVGQEFATLVNEEAAVTEVTAALIELRRALP